MSLCQCVINFNDLQIPRQIEERIHLPILDHQPHLHNAKKNFGAILWFKSYADVTIT